MGGPDTASQGEVGCPALTKPRGCRPPRLGCSTRCNGRATLTGKVRRGGSGATNPKYENGQSLDAACTAALIRIRGASLDPAPPWLTGAALELGSLAVALAARLFNP